jgi:hypothetical protein
MMIKKALLSLTAAATLSACGSQLELTNGSSESGSNSGQEAPEVTWSKVENAVDGTVTSGSEAGRLVVYIDRANQALVLVTPIPTFPLMAPIDVPDLPGTVIFSKEENGLYFLAAQVPLEHVIKGAQFGDPARLPNGDRIPYIVAGEPYGFSIDFPQQKDYRAYLYLSVEAVGLFVESEKVNDLGKICIIPQACSSTLKGRNGRQVNGYYAIIPPKRQFPAGIYIATQLPAGLGAVIDDLIRY